jgi:hypothetical protein
MRTSSIIFGIVLGCAARSSPVRRDVDLAAVERGQAIIGELKRSLLARLEPALRQGAAAAIAVCSVEAPSIAASLSRDGIAIGRATRKPRNPANDARGWRAEALAYFEARHASGAVVATTFSRRLDNGTVAVAEPLVIQEACTACHGAAIAADVQAALAERYPSDRATGYAVGDLRGIAWVELPPAP